MVVSNACTGWSQFFCNEAKSVIMTCPGGPTDRVVDEKTSDLMVAAEK